METKTTTLAVIGHHISAITEGIDAIMADYTEDSVLITPDATQEGLARIRGFFTSLFQSM